MLCCYCCIWSEVLLWTVQGDHFWGQPLMTGLREICPGISLIPRLHNSLGNEASPGIYNRYQNNSKRMGCMCLALLKQKTGFTNINEVN